MKITMLKTTLVSLDGITSTKWDKGIARDAPQDLAESLIKGGLAKLCAEKQEADIDIETPEKKAVLETPESPKNQYAEEVKNET